MTQERVYGYTELAERLGIKVGTLRVQHSRGQLPEPDQRLAAGPVWYAATIDRWINDKENGGS